RCRTRMRPTIPFCGAEVPPGLRGGGGVRRNDTKGESTAMTPSQPKIHIERMMHRNSIAVAGESAASYALVKLIPSGEGVGKPLGLNLALVLDVSGSMYEEDGTGISRLKRIQQAATAAIDKLKP